MTDCMHDVAVPYHGGSHQYDDVADNLLSLRCAKAESFAVALELAKRVGFETVAPSTPQYE